MISLVIIRHVYLAILEIKVILGVVMCVDLGYHTIDLLVLILVSMDTPVSGFTILRLMILP